MPQRFSRWLIVWAILVVLASGSITALEGEEESDTPLGAAEVVRLFGSSVVLIQADQGNDQTALGSGFFVDPKGVIATSLHLLDGAKSVRVRVEGERFELISVLAFDVERDLALLEIDAEGFEAVLLGDTASLGRGDAIFIIGNPLGLTGTVSEGIVGAWREPSFDEGDDSDPLGRLVGLPKGRLLQMSAAVTSGSSGAPVFDQYGYVVGIVAGGIGKGLDLNFAIPIDALLPLIGAGRGWDLASFQNTLDRRRRDLADPYLVDARFHLANGDYKETAKSLDLALGVFPRSAEALTLKGEILLAADQVEEAGELFQKAVDLNPDLAKAWENLGRFLQAYGPRERQGEAVAAYERALELEPWRAGSAVGLGIAYAERGYFEEAQAMLEQAVDSDREHLQAWIALGGLYLKLEDFKAAEEAFDTAVWIDGESAMANCGLAAVYYLTADQRVGEYRQRCKELGRELP